MLEKHYKMFRHFKLRYFIITVGKNITECSNIINWDTLSSPAKMLGKTLWNVQTFRLRYFIITAGRKNITELSNIINWAILLSPAKMLGKHYKLALGWPLARQGHKRVLFVSLIPFQQIEWSDIDIDFEARIHTWEKKIKKDRCEPTAFGVKPFHFWENLISSPWKPWWYLTLTKGDKSSWNGALQISWGSAISKYSGDFVENISL